jgi:lysyl-tRNA synthetase class 2
METKVNNSFIEDNDQTRARREHLDALRELIGNVYPNKFARSQASGNEDTITAILEKFAALAPHTSGNERPAPEAVEQANAELNKTEVRLSGRIATPPRVMGKAAFVHLSDGVSRLQIYVRKADVKAIHNDTSATIEEPADAGWQLFNLLDHGDFIGVAGYLFITKSGELSVHVRELYFLAKALLPMPDKMHGISDPEIRQRQRYADLIAGSLKIKTEEEEQTEKDGKQRELSPRETFELRSKLIRELRRYLDDDGYLEVETPMLTPKATGAAAKPFKTHHNALDIDLFARIAPELYLKRLVVGGFEKVYELNRNFRNEGLSTRHNPEFTMLEFYCAYMDVDGMMDFCEEMLRMTFQKATGSKRVRFDDKEFDFGRKFERLTMKQAISKHWSRWLVSELIDERINDDQLNDSRYVSNLVQLLNWWNSVGINIYLYNQEKELSDNESREILTSHATEKWELLKSQEHTDKPHDNSEFARNILFLFEGLVEVDLAEPTFIYDFPKPVSPLSKASPADSSIAERFELFIAGMEVANGFSELNDPVEQRERFLEQQGQRERGDEEAMVLDEDYIRALSYGMPPAAGIGIGIDRLVMILAGKRSIRDVILFPHMRPERPAEDEALPEQE